MGWRIPWRDTERFNRDLDWLARELAAVEAVQGTTWAGDRDALTQDERQGCTAMLTNIEYSCDEAPPNALAKLQGQEGKIPNDSIEMPSGATNGRMRAPVSFSVR